MLKSLVQPEGLQWSIPVSTTKRREPDSPGSPESRVQSPAPQHASNGYDDDEFSTVNAPRSEYLDHAVGNGYGNERKHEPAVRKSGPIVHHFCLKFVRPHTFSGAMGKPLPVTHLTPQVYSSYETLYNRGRGVATDLTLCANGGD